MGSLGELVSGDVSGFRAINIASEACVRVDSDCQMVCRGAGSEAGLPNVAMVVREARAMEQ